MNAFVLTCLVAVASAVPQGYNYQRPTGFGHSSGGFGHSSGGFGHSSGGFGHSSGGFGHSSGGFAPSFHQNFGSVGSTGGHGFGGVSAPSFSHSGSQHSNFGGASYNNFGGSSSGGHGFTHGGVSHGNIGGFSHGGSSHGNFGGFSSGSSASGFGGHGISGHQSHAHQAPIITKHFYIHSAPEETEADIQHETISTGPARKNYRVVFIKAPSQSSRSAAITLQQAQNEEKTVIYVLSKKTDAAEVHAAIQAAPTEATKPEVFFIKYKTNEEAAHAQHSIQSQYDALGGSTHVSDEGFAPVTSVIGALGQSSGGHGHAHGHGGAGGSFGTHDHFTAPSSGYLPSH